MTWTTLTEFRCCFFES